MQRFLDGEVRVAARGVDMRDGMTNSAGHAGMGRWMVDHVEIRIIKSPAEERNRIVTSGTPAGSMDVPITFEDHAACLGDGRQIGKIVE